MKLLFRRTAPHVTPPLPCVELYDHNHDPNELLNPAPDPTHGTVVAELRGLIHKLEK